MTIWWQEVNNGKEFASVVKDAKVLKQSQRTKEKFHYDKLYLGHHML
jgi:hypothetical protein